MAAAALGYGAWRWNQATRALVAQLQAARQPPAVRRINLQEADTLPPPVRRFFHAALTDGAPVATAVTLAHTGTFNLSADPRKPQWKPFSSTQQVAMQRPGFVWDARVQMLPGLQVHVHDAYVAGEGVLHPAVAGLFSLASLRDRSATAEGELMRWLAEAAWYPSALLPSQGVVWQAIDERSARATLRDGPLSASLVFRFGDDGLISHVRADTRGRMVDGRVVPTPWEGRWFDHRQHDGMRVPMRGEVAWLLPEGELPYWRGNVSALGWEPAR